MHEYLEYFPFGETWVHEKPTSGESVPYKFTSKELDPETGLYYFGARYYEPKVSRWVSADPALKEGKYFPKPNDFDTEHDYFWYVKQDASGKLPGIGGVFNAINVDVYHYAGQNPIRLIDPTGMWNDKSEKIYYDNTCILHSATLNKGTVTKGDTLIKLAEMQLKNETGSNKFTSTMVHKKVEQIKSINNLSGNTLKIGQNLILGLSNDHVTSEKAVQPLHGESFIAALAILKLGSITATTLKVGGPMMANYALEMGANVKVLGQVGLSMTLTNPVKANLIGIGFIQGIAPPSPYGSQGLWDSIAWAIGYIIGQKVNP